MESEMSEKVESRLDLQNAWRRKLEVYIGCFLWEELICVDI